MNSQISEFLKFHKKQIKLGLRYHVGCFHYLIHDNISNHILKVESICLDLRFAYDFERFKQIFQRSDFYAFQDTKLFEKATKGIRIVNRLYFPGTLKFEENILNIKN